MSATDSEEWIVQRYFAGKWSDVGDPMDWDNAMELIKFVRSLGAKRNPTRGSYQLKHVVSGNVIPVELIDG